LKGIKEMQSRRSLYAFYGISVPARLRPGPGWTERFSETLSRLASALKTELRARRAAAELAAMDDHMLRDIGISRSEIEHMVRQSPAAGRAPPEQQECSRP
jgi:uncharacterized protein YjiS (DUF1127 family)